MKRPPTPQTWCVQIGPPSKIFLPLQFMSFILLYVYILCCFIVAMCFSFPLFLYIFIYSYTINAHFYAPHASYHPHANIRLQPKHQYSIKKNTPQLSYFYACIYYISLFSYNPMCISYLI